MRSVNKYHNKRVIVDGQSFDSRREANRYKDLCFLERAGLISNLQRQVVYILTPTQYDANGVKIHGLDRSFYRADFVYHQDGKLVVEDCKGYRTDVYKLKKKLMYEKYGILIKET